MRYLLAVFAFLLGGCQLIPSRITSGKTVVTSVKDAGKPATLNTNFSDETLQIPENSLVRVTKYPAQSAKAATPTSPAQDAIPAKEVTEFVPSAAAVLLKHTEITDASTGTVDTSIRKYEIDAAGKRPLLYAALLCAVAAGFFVYRTYPTPALISGASAIVFFLAWKVSDIPSWFYALGIAGAAGAAFLYIGHERGEKAAAITNESPTPPTPAPK